MRFKAGKDEGGNRLPKRRRPRGESHETDGIKKDPAERDDVRLDGRIASRQPYG